MNTIQESINDLTDTTVAASHKRALAILYVESLLYNTFMERYSGYAQEIIDKLWNNLQTGHASDTIYCKVELEFVAGDLFKYITQKLEQNYLDDKMFEI